MNLEHPYKSFSLTLINCEVPPLDRFLSTDEWTEVKIVVRYNSP
jgi:hypothetical protein